MPDDDGMDLKDLAAARREAIASILDLTRETVKRCEAPKGITVQIADETGNVLDTLHAEAKLH